MGLLGLQAIPLANGDMVLFKMLCGQDLILKSLFMYFIVCPIICLRASSHYKHDMGALSC